MRRARPGNKNQTKRRREELSAEHTRDIKAAFDLFDVSGTGTIEGKELRVALRALGFDPSKEEIDQLIEKISNSGRIDFHDFLDIIIDKVSEPDNAEDIKTAFDMLDLDHSGTISKENLQTVINELGDDLSEQEIEKMIKVAQKGNKKEKKDRNLEISYKEFVSILQRTTE